MMTIQFKTQYTLVFKAWPIGFDRQRGELHYYLSLLLVAAIAVVIQLIRALYIRYSDRDKSRVKETVLYLLDILGATFGMFMLMTMNFGVILVTVVASTAALFFLLPHFQPVHYKGQKYKEQLI
jgi:uncharacterized membrane protein YsdA (DUF1294 family)